MRLRRPRVVYDYYGGEEVFPLEWTEMMEAVDKGDSAQFSRLTRSLHPRGWVLLNYLMDARTGLGRYRDFRISNYQLMMELIEHCAHLSIEEILELPDVQGTGRALLSLSRSNSFASRCNAVPRFNGNVLILDLREEEQILCLQPLLYLRDVPRVQPVDARACGGLRKQNTVFAVGKSIVNRSSHVNIGELMLSYDGGGHMNAGTCQIDNDEADIAMYEIIATLNGDPRPAYAQAS